MMIYGCCSVIQRPRLNVFCLLIEETLATSQSCLINGSQRPACQTSSERRG
ncbi:hypothetical protein LINPERHAP1_LOCUS38374 [Linum perenne]